MISFNRRRMVVKVLDRGLLDITEKMCYGDILKIAIGGASVGFVAGMMTYAYLSTKETDDADKRTENMQGVR